MAPRANTKENLGQVFIVVWPQVLSLCRDLGQFFFSFMIPGGYHRVSREIN
jgi:hypothetical protein